MAICCCCVRQQLVRTGIRIPIANCCFILRTPKMELLNAPRHPSTPALTRAQCPDLADSFFFFFSCCGVTRPTLPTCCSFIHCHFFFLLLLFFFLAPEILWHFRECRLDSCWRPTLNSVANSILLDVRESERQRGAEVGGRKGRAPLLEHTWQGQLTHASN